MAIKGILDKFSDVAKSVTDTLGDAVGSVEEKYNIGNDGKFDMNDVVSMLLKSEGSLVDRRAFLQQAMENIYSQDIIDKAIASNPIEAGLTLNQLKDLAAEVIKVSKEGTNAKNTLQEATGTLKDDINDIKETVSEEKKEDIAGGIVDMAKGLKEKAEGISSILTEDKYLKETLKAIQKIMYLYGVPEISINESGTFADTKSRLYMMMSYAAMSDIEYAKDAIRALIKYRDEIDENVKADMILNQEAIGEIIKQWRKSFVSEKLLMTAANSNPLVGKAAQKASFEKTFEPHCLNLIDALSDTDITNPDHNPSEKELEIIEAISKYF